MTIIKKNKKALNAYQILLCGEGNREVEDKYATSIKSQRGSKHCHLGYDIVHLT